MWKIVRISGRIISMPQRWLRICKQELLQFQSLRQVLKLLESRRACRAIGTIFWPCFLCQPLLGAQRWRRRQLKRLLKSEFTLFRNSSLLFHVVQLVKYWWIFMELNFKGLLRKSLSGVHALQKTWNLAVSGRSRATTAKKRTKSVLHVSSCYLANTCCFYDVLAVVEVVFVEVT